MFVRLTQAQLDGAVGRLEQCCGDIHVWIRIKTEVLLIGSRQQPKKISLSGAMVGNSPIAPVTSIRDLGALFDTHMTMVPYANAFCQSSRYQIKNIGKIRRFPNRDSGSMPLSHHALT